MKTFALDVDMAFLRGPDGNLVILDGLPAVMQNCETAMYTKLGEMRFALDKGMPFAQTVWDNYNPMAFEAAARKTLLAVAGVNSVTGFKVVRTGNTLAYAATIATIYGTGQISNVNAL